MKRVVFHKVIFAAALSVTAPALAQAAGKTPSPGIQASAVIAKCIASNDVTDACLKPAVSAVAAGIQNCAPTPQATRHASSNQLGSCLAPFMPRIYPGKINATIISRVIDQAASEILPGDDWDGSRAKIIRAAQNKVQMATPDEQTKIDAEIQNPAPAGSNPEVPATPSSPRVPQPQLQRYLM